MKHWITAALAVLLLAGFPAGAWAQELALGGQPLGIALQTEGVTVAGYAPVETAEGSVSPAREAGVCEGDRVLRLGDREIGGAQDFIDAAAALEGEETTVTLLRRGEELVVTLRPALSEDGRWMLGLWLRDESSGIGTLTFYDPETGVFGALGHGICDESGVLPIRGGQITGAQIVSVQPGSRGEPGELSGCADSAAVLGEVSLNSERGIYGVADTPLGEGSAPTGEASPGRASILCTLEGSHAREYEVEIQRVYSENGVQRLLLTVTDPLLQEISGGIVQGMSGSPILQDGRLVGAVTHVLVSDPCRGYGIGIADMLAEAGLAADRAA